MKNYKYFIIELDSGKKIGEFSDEISAHFQIDMMKHTGAYGFGEIDVIQEEIEVTDQEKPSDPFRLTVFKKTVYGNDLIYPACPKSELLARIAGDKTLTARTIDCAKAMGFTFTVKHDDSL